MGGFLLFIVIQVVVIVHVCAYSFISRSLNISARHTVRYIHIQVRVI